VKFGDKPNYISIQLPQTTGKKLNYRELLSFYPYERDRSPHGASAATAAIAGHSVVPGNNIKGRKAGGTGISCWPAETVQSLRPFLKRVEADLNIDGKKNYLEVFRNLRL